MQWPAEELILNVCRKFNRLCDTLNRKTSDGETQINDKLLEKKPVETFSTVKTHPGGTTRKICR